MVVALLIIIREMGLPMPAGASLISPWVDLTHSMPSIGGDDSGDFIPNTGYVLPSAHDHDSWESAEVIDLDSITNLVVLGPHHLETGSPSPCPMALNNTLMSRSRCTGEFWLQLLSTAESLAEM